MLELIKAIDVELQPHGFKRRDLQWEENSKGLLYQIWIQKGVSSMSGKVAVGYSVNVLPDLFGVVKRLSFEGGSEFVQPTEDYIERIVEGIRKKILPAFSRLGSAEKLVTEYLEKQRIPKAIGQRESRRCFAMGVLMHRTGYEKEARELFDEAARLEPDLREDADWGVWFSK